MSYGDPYDDDTEPEGFTRSGGGVLERVPTVAAMAPIQRGSALVRPAADMDDLVSAFQAYARVNEQLLEDSDYQPIAGKRFPKKSAWRKLGVVYGVSYALPNRPMYERDTKGRIIRAEFIVRAIAPNGRYADGWGACDRYERCCTPTCRNKHKHCEAYTGGDCPGWIHFSHAEHDIPATAETRAKNRAASDLFGMGTVSAEEIVGDTDEQREHNVRDEAARERGWPDADEEHRWHNELRNEIRQANAAWNEQHTDDEPDAIRMAMIDWQEEHGIERWPMTRDQYGAALAYLRFLTTTPPDSAPTDPESSTSTQDTSPAPSTAETPQSAENDEHDDHDAPDDETRQGASGDVSRPSTGRR